MPIMAIVYPTVANPITVPYNPLVAVVIQCRYCRSWKPEADGESGECTSALMADMVWSKWDAESPIMTAAAFEEQKYFEVAE